MDTWKFRDAKARFSELFDRALRVGPQIVTDHGENAVVVVAFRDFAVREGELDFKAFLTSVPLVELEMERRYHPPRRGRL